MIKIGNQTLYNDDCLKIISGLEDKSIDVIVTSPPYNLQKDYGTYKDDLPWDEYLLWIKKLSDEFFRILKDDGSFFLNIGSMNKRPEMSMEVCFEVMKVFKLQNHITWVKSITIKGEAFDRNNNPKPDREAIHSYGHFKPINSKRFLNNTFENIFHFTKTGENDIQRLAIGVPFNDCQNLYRRKHRNVVRCRGNTWYIPYRTVVSKAEKYNHPAGFPLELPLTCIKLHGIKDNLIVLDPFLGTGSTSIAAKQLNIACIGIELDKKFFDIAVQRMSQGESEDESS